jgi:uncharacterized membrane protein
MAKNIDVMVAFVNGDDNVKTKNLRIVSHEFGTRLFNYDTCLAERTVVGGEFRGYKVNCTKYSNSTTTIQNKLLPLIESVYGGHIKVAVNIPMGTKDLWTV